MTISTLAIGVLWLALAIPLGGIAWIIFIMLWEAFAGRHPSDFSDVKEDLDRLLQRGFHKGTLTISHRKFGHAMRFTKFFNAKGEHLVASTVGEGWTPECIEKLRTYCAAVGLDMAPAESRADGEPADWQINCGRDTALAQAVARTIWTDIFGLPADAHRKVVADSLSSSDALPVGPDHLPLSESEAKERRHKELVAQLALHKRRYLQEGRSIVSVGIVLTLIQITASIGLPIAMLLSIDTLPDWTMILGTLEAAGSTSSVVFLLIFLASYSAGALRKDAYHPKEPQGWIMLHEQIMDIAGPVIFRALPVAVVLIWLGI